jgi:hypothetical protein
VTPEPSPDRQVRDVIPDSEVLARIVGPVNPKADIREKREHLIAVEHAGWRVEMSE